MANVDPIQRNGLVHDRFPSTRTVEDHLRAFGVRRKLTPEQGS
jgi:hypothetical protein